MWQQQLKNQWVGLVGVLIAVTALLSSNWRSEQVEMNRTQRWAGFEILRELSALQRLTDQAHYGEQQHLGDPITGWSHVILIEDFAHILPPDVQQQATQLKQRWADHWHTLPTDEQSNQAITQSIRAMRAQVIQLIDHLE